MLKDAKGIQMMTLGIVSLREWKWAGWNNKSKKRQNREIINSEYDVFRYF